MFMNCSLLKEKKKTSLTNQSPYEPNGLNVKTASTGTIW